MTENVVEPKPGDRVIVAIEGTYGESSYGRSPYVQYGAHSAPIRDGARVVEVMAPPRPDWADEPGSVVRFGVYCRDVWVHSRFKEDCWFRCSALQENRRFSYQEMRDAYPNVEPQVLSDGYVGRWNS